ncbi:MAG: 1-acyl-sn-glycerol-3-phosphate acyltransferase [Chloroflexi bacterium]|nr:1-acyl-sn-glycerol-3-phosphate acyltransferase [Chloroflexota bacterium]
MTGDRGAPKLAHRRRPARVLLQALARLAFGLLAHVVVVGLENWPTTGPLIVVANHFHFGDPALMVSIAPVHMEFLAGSQLPGAPAIVRWIPALWGALRVRRGSVGSRVALRQAEAVLASNGVLGVFPEAGSWAQTLRRARPGTAFLAARTRARILPVGIDGMPEVLPSALRLRRATVTVRVGEPFGPLETAGTGRERREELDTIGHRIMEHIAALLPEQRRGLYSTDPAVREAAGWTEAFPWEDLDG